MMSCPNEEPLSTKMMIISFTSIDMRELMESLPPNHHDSGKSQMANLLSRGG